MFELESLHAPPRSVAAASSSSGPVSFILWHSHLGHAFLSKLQKLISCGYLGSVKTNSNFHCLACQTEKQHALPFFNSDSLTSAPFDLVHFDVWGPSPISTMRGSRYLVIFIDDYSRYTWLYLMHSRSELLGIYDEFQKMIQMLFSLKIKIFYSDNA